MVIVYGESGYRFSRLGDPERTITAYASALDPTIFSDFEASGDELDVVPSTVEELATAEIDLAVADFPCREQIEAAWTAVRRCQYRFLSDQETGVFAGRQW